MAECVPNRKLIAELMEKEEKRLEQETPKSYGLYQRAVKHMPMGVASTYQARDPYPIYFTHGKGPHIWTIEGREIVDFHNGFGCMVQGHAHPVIVEAILSFVNLSISTDDPTWGVMIAEGRAAVHQAWWVLVFPLITLFLTVLSFSQLGEGLKDRFDPVLR